ncbi:MAG: YigZ family protein [Desulfobacula sp.]|jgi:uncharacterized YigZ family protein
MADEHYFYSVGRQRIKMIKIKRSVFVCTLDYVESIEKAKEFISRISKENKTATHNCWAYILGEKGEVFHSSDAGEPSGTAGKPMLNILKNYHMTQTAAVVTRYFGGVKLGVRGLMDAYAESIKQTLDMDELKKLTQTIRLEIQLPYGINDTVINLLKPCQAEILKTAYTDKVVHTIEIEKNRYGPAENLLMEFQSQGKLRFQVLSRNGS